MAPRGQRHAPDGASPDTGLPGEVVGGQPLVDHDEVGSDQGRHRFVAADDLGHEGPRLGPHRVEEGSIEVRVERRVGRGGLEITEIEPLVGEVGDESSGAWVIEHPLDLGPEDLRLRQLPSPCQGEQRIVGHRVPEEIGES